MLCNSIVRYSSKIVPREVVVSIGISRSCVFTLIYQWRKLNTYQSNLLYYLDVDIWRFNTTLVSPLNVNFFIIKSPFFCRHLGHLPVRNSAISFWNLFGLWSKMTKMESLLKRYVSSLSKYENSLSHG